MKNIDMLARTAQLAQLADSSVCDNPRVGAVLVHQGRIIGEGYHHRAGEAHAEVNCLASVSKEDRELIPKSTLFVSLEPCCIKGRTPACTGLILKEQIRKVVFPQRDTTDEVSGRSAAILREAKVRVKEYPDFLPTEATNINRLIYTTEQRPFVLLKFARSADGYLRPKDRSRKYWITNDISRRLVHRWRTDTNAVIVGARTVIDDDPKLNARFFPGPDPRPVVIDLHDRLTGKEKIFSAGGERPLVFTGRKAAKLRAETVEMKEKDLNKKAIKKILRKLHDLKFGHVTVEGGATTLAAFLEYGYWDEARRFTGPVRFGNGLLAPEFPASARLTGSEHIGTDVLEYFKR
ncbi:diaminohydroxyphosphoribosylaminopyrimidine deaminase/5-amino-6-(5-phosphoribosylamino)uracil reductase [Lewinella aquimaris]|uniref:Riboflavin biosynthesis protein RibD n=1 Tax=Neolewinella aquimaris TaxID=1835722 RepID=A0A840E9K4_9BACT|nr:bifunctional diaminohydroxyphosphoribosylaminopyrimidine deaminase/5-amino-6-(5-phosphoribosylamino)uracil reductase RibD [Neolewinella aquimaris]MBB4078489.1 diaminohydroxyphosphoribosylaminopyrimidine deaminase/5-amino-6-(5-phosphoribosylamino)uracil reductase [Neolewinella aquimaris]